MLILTALLVFTLLHFFYVRQVRPDFADHLYAIENKLDKQNQLLAGLGKTANQISDNIE